MPLFYQPDVSTGKLSSEESRHATRTLRLRDGDRIELTDGKGNIFNATIRTASPAACSFELIGNTHVPKRPYSIHLAIAPTKNADRIEWLVEKCVEMGIEKITLIACRHSERTSFNLDRLNKIAISAMKQSQQAWLPSVEGVIPFKNLIGGTLSAQRFIAHLDEASQLDLTKAAKSSSDYVVLVGPEGDFSQDELQLAAKARFQQVSLGPHRLRTETAGLVAVMMLNILNRP